MIWLSKEDKKLLPLFLIFRSLTKNLLIYYNFTSVVSSVVLQTYSTHKVKINMIKIFFLYCGSSNGKLQ